MEVLKLQAEVTDHAARIHYLVYAPEKLPDAAVTGAIQNKSLHTLLGYRALFKGKPAYQIIKVVAAEGWESAE
jgi:hypothetical protein